MTRKEWSKDEEKIVIDWYAEMQRAVRSDFNLDGLAENLGRTKVAVCGKARRLGLTDNSRKILPVPKSRRKYATDEERKAALSAYRKTMWVDRPHPKGNSGKKHTDETRALLSEKSKAAWSRLSDSERDDWVEALAKSHKGPPKVKRGQWAAGWREIGGKRNYYRSRWEANYARWLEFLKKQGKIKEWAHEPETFWFEGIKRGVCSYKPDFRVTENDGTSKLHEVKGYMCPRSATTLKRMSKYHPKEIIVLIQEADMKSIAKVACLLDGWECANKPNSV